MHGLGLVSIALPMVNAYSFGMVPGLRILLVCGCQCDN